MSLHQVLAAVCIDLGLQTKLMKWAVKIPYLNVYISNYDMQCLQQGAVNFYIDSYLLWPSSWKTVTFWTRTHWKTALHRLWSRIASISTTFHADSSLQVNIFCVWVWHTTLLIIHIHHPLINLQEWCYMRFKRALHWGWLLLSSLFHWCIFACKKCILPHSVWTWVGCWQSVQTYSPDFLHLSKFIWM